MTDLESAVQREERTPAGAALWAWWAAATAAGWGLAGALIGATISEVGSPWQYVFVPLSAAGQWLVLRRRFARASLWLVATAAGAAVAGLAYAVLLALPAAIAGPPTSGLRLGLSTLVDGVALGVAQWLVLRRAVRGAGWWIPATMAPLWLFGLLDLSRGLEPATIPAGLTTAERVQLNGINAAIIGLFMGAVTGGVLMQLVRQPPQGGHE